MSPKHGRKEDSKKKEQLPILLVHEEEQATHADNISNDVIEEIDSSSGGQMWRISSYNFWNDDIHRVNNASFNGKGFVLNEAAATDGESPRKQLGEIMSLKQVSDEISIDMDEVQSAMDGLPPVLEENEDLKVMVSQSNEVVEGAKKSEKDEAAVVKCSSSDMHQTRSRLLRSKPRSRLLDPMVPESSERRSGQISRKSGQQKSGYLSGRTDEEEEDPFLDVDIPEEYKKINISKVTMVESISLVLLITALICSVKIPVLRKKTLWDLALWKWEVLLLVLICGRLVSAGAMRAVVFLIMRNFLLRKRVLYFVYGLRKAVQNCVWLGLVLLTWHFLFDKRIRRENRSKPLQYVTKILVCFLLGTLIWLIKTLIVKVLASYFHVSTYFDRIHESLFNQYVIETLSGPPLVEMQRVVDEEARLVEDVEQLQKAGANVPPELKASVFTRSSPIGRSGRIEKGSKENSSKFSGVIHGKQEEGIPIEHFHRLNPKNVSAWNMKLLINIVRYDTLTTLNETLLDATETDEKQTQIRSEFEAKAAAKKIFNNVAKPGSKYIKLDDLMRFMEEEEAVKTLSLFEGASETGRISKSSLKNWVVKAFRERKALSLTLNDTKTAVKRLHQMLNVVVIVVIGLIWLIILGVTTSKLILLFGSQLVVCAFIFGNTLKNIFEALIFLFIIHPFDVGDRCEIDGKEYVVEEMNIMSTVFLRDDNLKMTYMNNWLTMKAIHNFHRSPDMGDAIDFCVHIATPAEKIALIKQRITSYIESKKDTWSSPMLVMRDVIELDMVKYSVWLSHTINFQDMGERFKRRSQLVEEMVKIFKELDVEYRISKKQIPYAPMPGPNSARLPPTWAPPARN